MPLFGTFASGALWLVESFTSHEMTLGSVFRIQRVDQPADAQPLRHQGHRRGTGASQGVYQPGDALALRHPDHLCGRRRPAEGVAQLQDHQVGAISRRRTRDKSETPSRTGRVGSVPGHNAPRVERRGWGGETGDSVFEPGESKVTVEFQFAFNRCGGDSC